MTHACDRARTANLVGAFALAAAERGGGAIGGATGRPASDTAALVVLATTLRGASQDVLAQVLGLTQSGSVRLVDRLARDGLVERRPGHDGRTHAIVPTAAGAAAAQRALGARHAATAAILGALDDAEREQLTVLTDKLLGAMTQTRADAYRICRLCDPGVCGHDAGRCPVTRAADDAEAAAERRS